jgi:hypothetical protein
MRPCRAYAGSCPRPTWAWLSFAVLDEAGRYLVVLAVRVRRLAVYLYARVGSRAVRPVVRIAGLSRNECSAIEFLMSHDFTVAGCG